MITNFTKMNGTKNYLIIGAIVLVAIIIASKFISYEATDSVTGAKTTFKAVIGTKTT